MSDAAHFQPRGIRSVRIHNFRSIADISFSLDRYSLLIGANNCGKTNVVDAIRVFFEAGGYRYVDSRDKPMFATADDESWIEIEFEIATNDCDETMAGRQLKVRRCLSDECTAPDGTLRKSGYYVFEDGNLATQAFCRPNDVRNGLLGNVIYIPALSKIDDHTKLTGPSELRELLESIVQDVARSSRAYAQFASSFHEFGNTIQTERGETGLSLQDLVTDINEEIREWGAEARLVFSPIDEADMVKSLVSLKFSSAEYSTFGDHELSATQFGQGFQRHLIFSLIRLAAKYRQKLRESTTAEQPGVHQRFTLVLFEEPEAFLHPSQQLVLHRSLTELSQVDSTQILISSHSPHFVSSNAEKLPSIIRLCRENHATTVGQLTTQQLSEIFESNLAINELVRGTKFESHSDDDSTEAEALKLFLWLDPNRCGMFFAGHVLLVEGPTERVLIDYLIDDGRIIAPEGGLFVLDCMGKFNIHRFMNLCAALKVTHSVIFDEDGAQSPHPEIRKLIEDSRNEYTVGIETIPGELEQFLGIETTVGHRRPHHVMLKLRDGSIPKEALDRFVALVMGSLTGDSVNARSGS